MVLIREAIAVKVVASLFFAQSRSVDFPLKLESFLEASLTPSRHLTHPAHPFVR
jgi:hypothetical protein